MRGAWRAHSSRRGNYIDAYEAARVRVTTNHSLKGGDVDANRQRHTSVLIGWSVLVCEAQYPHLLTIRGIPGAVSTSLLERPTFFENIREIVSLTYQLRALCDHLWEAFRLGAFPSPAFSHSLPAFA
jgi:hypothetical protein